jgi:hypothetical protein
MVNRVALVLVLADLGAWSGSDTRSPRELTGDYQFIELNGESLPFDHAMGCCIYTSGNLVLQSGQYEVVNTFRNKINDSVANVMERGTYGLYGSAIEFEPTEGDVAFSLYDGQVQGHDHRSARRRRPVTAAPCVAHFDLCLRREPRRLHSARVQLIPFLRARNLRARNGWR